MPERRIEGEIERIRQIYCCDVLKKPNREVRLLGRKCEPELMSTLLGFELKLGRLRVACPDLASARYLKAFAEIGLAKVRIPYDPTRTSVLLEGLEHALTRIKRILDQEVPDERRRRKETRRIYARIREVCRCPEDAAALDPA